jgi:hypothetical protein
MLMQDLIPAQWLAPKTPSQATVPQPLTSQQKAPVSRSFLFRQFIAIYITCSNYSKGLKGFKGHGQDYRQTNAIKASSKTFCHIFDFEVDVCLFATVNKKKTTV